MRNLFNVLSKCIEDSLGVVNNDIIKEAYFDRILHNYLGINKIKTISIDYEMKHKVTGYIHENKIYDLTPDVDYTTLITPDINIHYAEKLNFFVEIKKVSNRDKPDCWSFFYGEAGEKFLSKSSVPLPVVSYDCKSAHYYDGKAYFFNEGQIWADIIRILSICNNYPFFIVLYVDNWTKTIDEMIYKFNEILNELKIMKKKEVFCYSPPVSREVISKTYPLWRVWIDKLYTDKSFSVFNDRDGDLIKGIELASGKIKAIVVCIKPKI